MLLLLAAHALAVLALPPAVRRFEARVLARRATTGGSGGLGRDAGPGRAGRGDVTEAVSWVSGLGLEIALRLGPSARQPGCSSREPAWSSRSTPSASSRGSGRPPAA
ncbi:MAG TPA: hypothetical protein VE709_00300 [Pseudonocardiaceae bacterium]|nr:hypothetical protein [Pseudonocardiaceae bacterium]